MNDPERLLEHGATELELSLLRAGDAEGPSSGARQAALAALGLSGAVLSSSATAAATTAALAPRAGILAAKWWAVGAVVAAAGSGGVAYIALTGDTASEQVDRSAPARVVTARGAIDLARSRQSASATPAPLTSPPRDAVRVRGPRAATAVPSGVQEQVALIDRARSAAGAGQPAAALTALDEYQRRFPNGVLGQEATMLRIEASLARGDKATATRLGQRFLELYPRSALAPRVRQLTHD